MDLLGLFIGYPWVAFVVAAAFLVGWRARGVPPMLLAAIAWAAYGAYEYRMQTAWCTGECNIRVDLLLFYPILLIVSAFAIWRFYRS